MQAMVVQLSSAGEEAGVRARDVIALTLSGTAVSGKSDISNFAIATRLFFFLLHQTTTATMNALRHTTSPALSHDGVAWMLMRCFGLITTIQEASST